MREKAGGKESKTDIRMRQHLMERSFARAVRYGFKRARWRGLRKASIQEYLTAAIQNIKILVRHGNPGHIAKAEPLALWKIMPKTRNTFVFIA
jgi:hypothetical protein